MYTGTNQVITSLIPRLAHTVQYVIENREEPGNEAGYYNSIMLIFIWQLLCSKLSCRWLPDVLLIHPVQVGMYVEVEKQVFGNF